MKEKYAIWTYYKGTIGTRIFRSTKRGCNEYIKQAIKKGEDPKNFIILKVTKYG